MIKLCPFSQRVVSLLQQTWLIPFVRYNSPGDAWEHMISGLNSLFFGILSLFTGNARGYTMSYYLFSRYEYSYSWVVSLCQPAGSKKFNNTKHVSRMSSQGGKQSFVYLHFTNTFVLSTLSSVYYFQKRTYVKTAGRADSMSRFFDELLTFDN